MLWKAKNKERDPLDLKLDRWFLLTSTILPLTLFVVRTRLMDWRSAQWIGGAALVVYLGFTGVYIWRQVQKHRAHLPMNTPKLLLLSVLVPLQWMAFLDAASLGPDGIIRAGIALGLFHSFQYHRLLWFHNRNRYSTPMPRNGMAWPRCLRKTSGIIYFSRLACTFFSRLCRRPCFPQSNGSRQPSGGSPSPTTCSIRKFGAYAGIKSWLRR